MRYASLFPARQTVDYEALLSAARIESTANLGLILQERLPAIWGDRYQASVGHRTNLVRFRSRSFEYLYDLYSELEVTGEVPYDQTIEDRVVGVLGTSMSAESGGDLGGRRGWLEPCENLLETERDKGHFMARCIGGGLEVNVFSQDRRLNRGWSPQGKLYRQMETYCFEQPGTFCFSRPIYADGSSVPRWLEFGLLRSDQTLWVEVFDN